MDSNTPEKQGRSVITLLPNSAICFNFVSEGTRLKKSSWLVPHVIKHREDTEVISWRCSWGHMCESGCFYAMAKEMTKAHVD